MEKLKNLKISTIFKKFLICFCISEFLIFGSATLNPEPVRVFADTDINDSNSKSIFINLAFMVMSALGIQTVRSATGLGNALEGSLGDFFDNWLQTTSLTVSGITSMVIAHTKVTKANNVSLGSALYNTIADFINYLYKVPQVFTPADNPYFTYDLPGSYLIPLTPFLFTLSNSSDSSANAQQQYLKVIDDSVRLCFYQASNGIFVYAVSLASNKSFSVLFSDLTTRTERLLSSTTIVNGITYYFTNFLFSSSAFTFVDNLNYIDTTGFNGALAAAVYYTFGVGAVGGTDGTIGLPDPITRNRDTPIPNVNDGDSVPLAVPDSYAHDWPLDDDTDIPLSIPQAIPWVYDLPIDTPLDVPIDLPFYFSDPGNIPIPPAVIDVPDDWYNVPLIVEPECVSLSGCLVSGVSTVSNHLTNFYNIHPEIATVTALSLGIGFALLVLGVIL